MSMSMLVSGGVDCGPSNALQGLTKNLDRDRGVQQDHFGVGRAGSSRQTFRTQTPRELDADAARFFSNSPHPAQVLSPSPFNVSELQHALPAFSPHVQQQQQQPKLPSSSSWATDFLQQTPSPSAISHAQKPATALHPEGMHTSSPMPIAANAHAMSPSPLQWQSQPAFANRVGFMGHGMVSPSSQMSHTQASVHHAQSAWDKEFMLQESALNTAPQKVEEQTASQVPIDGDELARTAGLLIEQVKEDQNPKFQNSQFLGLMRQLRDREVVVEGNEMVQASEATLGGQTTSRDIKGKGKEPMSFVGQRTFSGDPQNSAGMSSAQESDNDRYFRQENEAYTKYWDDFSQKPETRVNMEGDNWGVLHDQWERFEATATGIKPITTYTFQSHNPYLLGNSSSTRNHALHADGRYQTLSDSVLELEAAVQHSPTNVSAWYELGVKQQENEREKKAVQALQRATELDPSYLPSWIALAVSHTNDNNRSATYACIYEWVSRNEKYKDAVARHRAENPLGKDVSSVEKFSNLVGTLIAMARSDVAAGVDADIQVALAVLLNTNEEYEKAQDCFRAALAVRPGDWLLYNRVGATLANSGRPEEALEYYGEALALNPSYIRARYNMGISCINLRRYEESAQHVLDALVLQDSDRAPDPSGFNEKRGVTSNTLWDSLKTACLHMQRVDLATLCDQRDLNGFRDAFFS